MKQRTKGAKVHFASLMDIYLLKNAELEAKHQQYKGRIVLPGDIVKDDSGSYTVFIEQGSSASQMTAAKVMDIISRLPLRRTSSWRSICLYPGKNWGCTQITENSQIGESRHLDTSATTQNDLNHGPVWKTQLFFLNGICTIILWQDCYGKNNLRKSYCSTVGRRFPIGNAYSYIIKKVILICVCGWHQIGWKETKHWSDVESTQQRSRFGRTNIFPWSCLLGLHSKTMWNKQRYCGQLQNHFWITNFRGVNWKTYRYSENFRISSWSYDMEGHAKKCVERYCELANKTQQLYKVSTPCIDDHHFKRGRIEICRRIVTSMLSNCSEMLKTWHVLEDLIFYGQWTNLHDRLRNGPKLVTNAWIVWYLKFITHVNKNSIVMWVILQNNADWDCFKTPILRGDLEDSKSTSGGTLCVFGCHTFVPISWMCNKQTSVSHSSTESEIISLDAGLRLDGIPALDLWDLIVSVFGNTTQNHDKTVKLVVCRGKLLRMGRW